MPFCFPFELNLWGLFIGLIQRWNQTWVWSTCQTQLNFVLKLPPHICASYDFSIHYQVEIQPSFCKECNFQQRSLVSHFISVLEALWDKLTFIYKNKHRHTQRPSYQAKLVLPDTADQWHSTTHAPGECGSCKMKSVRGGPALSPWGCSTKPHLKPPQLRN